jgi:hypothetical protein
MVLRLRRKRRMRDAVSALPRKREAEPFSRSAARSGGGWPRNPRLAFSAVPRIVAGNSLAGARQFGPAVMMGDKLPLPRALVLLACLSALGGCQTDSNGLPVADGKPQPAPMTHEQAALECWMSTEHGRADLPLDKRADIVDKCINDKMSGKTPAAETKKEAKPKSAKPAT